MASQRVHLIRHGETEWSLSGRHTGTTDIPLTANGRRLAEQWEPILREEPFARVLTSPLRRARETCELAGLGRLAEIDPDLLEWDYGEYEGLTPRDIRARNPDWMIFRDGCPGGESPRQVASRIDRIISRIRAVQGPVALFSHGHLLRSFAARWIGLGVSEGSHFMLNTATLCVLSYYQGAPAIKRWNVPLVRRPPESRVLAAQGGRAHGHG